MCFFSIKIIIYLHFNDRTQKLRKRIPGKDGERDWIVNFFFFTRARTRLRYCACVTVVTLPVSRDVRFLSDPINRFRRSPRPLTGFRTTTAPVLAPARTIEISFRRDDRGTSFRRNLIIKANRGRPVVFTRSKHVSRVCWRPFLALTPRFNCLHTVRESSIHTGFDGR